MEEFMKLLAKSNACMRALAGTTAFALLTATLTFAQTASSKATAAISTAVGCTSSGTTTIGDTLPVNCHDIFSGASVPVTADNFVQIMTTTMKVSNSQSIFASPSLVTGLYTNTKTKTSTGGNTSTATAEGGVYLRVVLRDPNTNAVVQVADPVADCNDEILGCTVDTNGDYGVVLDSRVQTLSQTLSACVVTVTGTAGGSCNFSSTLQLVLQTTSAHTFNFIFPNVGVGTYNISVEAAVNTGATVSGSGTAIAGAAYGLGSLTAESVRMVHSFSF
jgi:hypothetical protein